VEGTSPPPVNPQELWPEHEVSFVERHLSCVGDSQLTPEVVRLLRHDTVIGTESTSVLDLQLQAWNSMRKGSLILLPR
jgi:hypothetical protein